MEGVVLLRFLNCHSKWHILIVTSGSYSSTAAARRVLMIQGVAVECGIVTNRAEVEVEAVVNYSRSGWGRRIRGCWAAATDEKCSNCCCCTESLAYREAARQKQQQFCNKCSCTNHRLLCRRLRCVGEKRCMQSHTRRAQTEKNKGAGYKLGSKQRIERDTL